MSMKYARELIRIRKKYARRLKKFTDNLKEKEKFELQAVNKLIRFRNVEMLEQNIRGVSYVAIAKRFDLSPTRVREIILREERKWRANAELANK